MAPNLTDIIAGKLAPYVTAQVSPDKRWAVVTAAVEMRMSHWVEQAALWQVSPEQMVLEFGASLWSTESIQWHEDSRQFTAYMRCYPGTLPGFSVTVVPAAGQVQADSEVVSFDDFGGWLSRYEQRGRR